MSKHLPLFLIVGVAGLLFGCGTTQQVVDKHYDENASKLKRGADSVITANVASDGVAVHRVQGAWLGMRSTPLQADSSLPQIFRRQVSLRFPGRVNIATIAERLTKVTGIPVSVKPDVLMPATAFIKAGASVSGSGSTNSNPAASDKSAYQGLSYGLSSASVENNATEFEMNFEGPLAAYLDLLSAKAGISWEYREGVISLHRLVTKVFLLKAIPGSSSFDSSLGRTSTASAGSGQTTAGFNSTSNISMVSKFSVWSSLETSIKSIMSSSGKLAMSEATGSITITDTRDVVEQVGRLIDQENAMLTRQIAMRVEVLSVKLNTGNEHGIDWTSVFSQLSGNFQMTFNSPISTVSGNAANFGISVLSPVSGTTGSATQQRFGGSQALFKALNTYGRVSVVTTANALTLNRQPVPVAITNQTSYLAEVTPSTGGGVGTVGGTPGLKSGVVTTGFLLNLLPTVLDSSSILLQFSVGISELNKLVTVSSGVGSSQQSIQTPEISGTEFLQRVAMRPGETLVLSGYERTVGQYDRRALAEDAPIGFGGSLTGVNNREAVIILVTPVLSNSAT